MTTEPALILASIAAALNTVQTATFVLPAWAHALIAAASIILAGLITRTQVVPMRTPVRNATPPGRSPL